MNVHEECGKFSVCMATFPLNSDKNRKTFCCFLMYSCQSSQRRKSLRAFRECPEGKDVHTSAQWRPSSVPRTYRHSASVAVNRNAKQNIYHSGPRFKEEEFERKQRIQNPGPGTYDFPSTFGQGTVLSHQRRGPAFSLTCGPGPGAVTHTKASRQTEYRLWKKLHYSYGNRESVGLVRIKSASCEGPIVSPKRMFSCVENGNDSSSHSNGSRDFEVEIIQEKSTSDGAKAVHLHPYRVMPSGRGRRALGFTDYVQRNEFSQNEGTVVNNLRRNTERDVPGAIELARCRYKNRDIRKKISEMSKRAPKQPDSIVFEKASQQNNALSLTLDNESGESTFVSFVPVCGNSYPRWRVQIRNIENEQHSPLLPRLCLTQS